MMQKDNNLKISIITVCKNAEKTIERTILSVLNQTYTNIEYIIIDGQSTDKTTNIINKYKDKISLIISEKDNGIFNAMNKAISLASGEYLNFMNADDFFDNSNVIQNIVNAISVTPNCDMIFGDFKYFDNKNNSFILMSYKNIYSDYFLFLKRNLNHQSIFYKKNIFEKFGKYEEIKNKITADTKYNIQLVLKSNINIYYIPTVIANYSRDGFSAKNLKIFNKEMNAILFQYYGFGVFYEKFSKLFACMNHDNILISSLHKLLSKQSHKKNTIKSISCHF